MNDSICGRWTFTQCVVFCSLASLGKICEGTCHLLYLLYQTPQLHDNNLDILYFEVQLDPAIL